MEHNLIEAVYYISMNKSVERRKLLKNVLNDEVFDSMKKHRIEAIDGLRKDSVPYLNKHLKNMQFDLYNTKVYGCLLSHLNTLLEFSKSNYDIALIVEDDLSLEYKQYWQKSLNTCIQDAPADWEIIQVAYHGKIPSHLYTPWNNHFCTAAYIVNKKGIDKFLKHNYINKYFVLDTNIRNEADRYIFKLIKTYTYKYPFFTFTAIDSNMNYKSNSLTPSYVKKKHVPFKKKVEAMLKRKTKRKKLP